MKQLMMKPLIMVLLLTTTPVWAQNDKSLRVSPEQASAFGVKTAPVETADRLVGKTLPAKVMVPNAQLRVVGGLLDGVVESLLVAEGEPVKKGQPLALIRSAQLLEKQASFLEARTRRVLARQTLERDRKLYAEGIIAERRLLETQASYRELRNAEARDRQALTLAGMPEQAIDQLARTQRLSAVITVRSPLNGVVLAQLATAGQRLAAADPLYRIGDLSTLWVEVHVPLEALGDVARGSLVELPDQGLTGKVISVGRMVHDTDQGVLVRAAITEGAQQLRPGQFVRASLQLAGVADALRVPAAAVVRNAGKDYVFAQDKQGFVALPVEVLAREQQQVVIRARLQAGERVATRGTAALKALWVGGGE